jgi:hypothetical protein
VNTKENIEETLRNIKSGIEVKRDLEARLTNEINLSNNDPTRDLYFQDIDRAHDPKLTLVASINNMKGIIERDEALLERLRPTSRLAR